MTAAARRPFGRDEVVEALLDAANRLFATAGPADVSLRSIARAAGVNHGLVYRHFGTRDALVDRLLERIAAEWTAEVQALGDFRRAIDSILGNSAEAEASASAWIRLLAWSLLTDAPGRSGEAQRRYATLDLLLAWRPKLGEHVAGALSFALRNATGEEYDDFAAKSAFSERVVFSPAARRTWEVGLQLTVRR